ncbi:MAG: hypothetical protein WD689_01145 [Gaiellaceae bacterium]
MRRLLALLAPAGDEPVVPAWLGGEYADGTLEFRFPSWWSRSTSERWGERLSDERSHHPAFVSVRYLDTGLPDTQGADRSRGRYSGS